MRNMTIHRISWRLLALLVLFTPMLAAQADIFRFEIRRNATPQAYYVHLLFKGVEPGDITTVPQHGGILVRYQASKEKSETSDAGGVRYFSSSRMMNSRIAIPPDGDLSRMQRIDKPGWIQLIVPRRGR